MRSIILHCATVALVCLAVARADESSTASPSYQQSSVPCWPTRPEANRPSASEPDAVGGGIVFDEHVLTNGSRDEDYDGGGEVTLSGQRGGLLGRALEQALGFIDGVTCPRSRFENDDWDVTHAFASGLLIFTPQDLAAREVVRGDRPYASEFFVSVGRRYTSPEEDIAYDTTLTVGVLGLPAAEAVQSTLHRLTNSAHPNGWTHQISAGGEPTARYNLARQALLADFGDGDWRGDAKWTAAASAGTVTEGSLAVNARWGQVESPWSSFAPEENMYVQETQPVPAPLPPDAPPELFVFAGARAKLRAYNAFLQGQFRQSDLTYGEGSLNQVLGEAWAGVEMRTYSGWSIQYLARWESPELRSGIGSRSFLWGSLEVAKSFR
ncbi:MAG TPA: lipid A-modifier LpxR family protein [Steroidobacteraceae bacterium]|nr:lipid A-modifier LpxR family protein [Steroidobacteraceae bacterium]